MTRDEMHRRIGEIHNAWAPTARVVVDPRYAKPVDEPSQYATGIEATSAIAEDDQVALDQIHDVMYEWYTSNDMNVPAWLQRAMDNRAA